MEGKVQRGLLVHTQYHAAGFFGAKSGCVNPDRIGRRPQPGQGEESLFVGFGAGRDVGGDIGDRDLGILHHRARGVSDRASNLGCVTPLGKNRTGQYDRQNDVSEE